MHIPGSMLNGAVCPVTVAVGVAGTGLAVWAVHKAEEKPGMARFATVTALVFALQMLNYPVANGTSGHLLGAMLAVALLGIPCAVISMALVLGVQAVFFGDGGINALGANVLNMALIGAAIGGMIFEFQKKKGVPFHAALAVASWVSVMAAAVACSVEVALSGTAAFSKVLPAMVSVHALIGAGEAVFTVALVVALLQCARAWKSNEAAVAFASFAVAVGAAFLSPFASNFPDGLEKVSQKLGFLSFGEMPFKAVFADYRLFSVTSEFWSTLGAGLAGTFIVLAASYITSRALKLGNREKASFSC